MKMSKLKARFKRALFAFFKDEILSSIGRIESKEIYDEKGIKMTLLQKEIVLNEREIYEKGALIGEIYEVAMRKAKNELITEAIKFIQVDEKSLLDENVFWNRKIRISLFVGKKY